MFYRRRLLTLALLLSAVAFIQLEAQARNEASELAFEQGLSYYEEKNWAQALAEFDKVIAANPSDATAHHYRGMTLMELRQPDEAIKALEKSRQLDPQGRDINLDLGIAYMKAGNVGKAEAAFKEEIRLYPKNARAWFSLGYLYFQMKRYDEAIASFSMAREIDPGMAANARFYEGRALMDLGRKDEAAAAFKEVLSLKPSPQLADAASRYLAALEPGKAPEKGKSWSIVGSMLYQYDSNVVAASDDTVFPITINDEGISNQEDSRGVVSLFAAWKFFDSDPWSAMARYAFYQSFHLELDEFNLQNHAPELSISRALSEGGREETLTFAYRGGVAMLSSELDLYSINHWGTASYTIRWSDNYADTISYRVNSEDFDNNQPNRDNTAHSIIFDSMYSFWSKKALLKTSIGFDFEDAVDPDYDVYRPWAAVSLEALLPLKFQTKLGLYYEYENHFDSVSNRVDDVLTVDFMAFRPIWGPLEANANFNYRMNNSTESIFEYERTIAGGGLVFRF